MSFSLQYIAKNSVLKTCIQVIDYRVGTYSVISSEPTLIEAPILNEI